MVHCKEIHISTQGVRSLVWEGDALVDWVDGGQRYLLTGETIARAVYFPFPFNAAVVSPSGKYSVIYSEHGTKGLVLCNGEHVREINRSYYLANATAYPVTLAQLKSGREVIIHCPDEYCTLEIEDVETGARLSPPRERASMDFFHSGLQASPDGSLLISAGWVWHPIDMVHVFDLAAALENPSELDGTGFDIDACADACSAVFLPERRIAVAMNNRSYGNADAAAAPPTVTVIRVIDLSTPTVSIDVPVNEPIGSMMALGHNHILSLCQHPKLIDLTTGEVIQRWPHLDLLAQTDTVPCIALDSIRQRCAIADSDGITVLDFGGFVSTAEGQGLIK